MISTYIPAFGRKANQLGRRGWSRDDVDRTVNAPFATRPALDKSTGNPATAYFNQDGSHIIRDDVSGRLVQMSDRLDPGSWIPDPTIVDPYIP